MLSSRNIALLKPPYCNMPSRVVSYHLRVKIAVPVAEPASGAKQARPACPASPISTGADETLSR